jgi:hypothetical protein
VVVDFFGASLSDLLPKHPRRVRLVLVRPPLFSARRIVGIHILVIPACQRYRKHQVVMRRFPSASKAEG